MPLKKTQKNKERVQKNQTKIPPNGHKFCSNCGCKAKPLADFKGARGQICKTCNKCRKKGAKYDKKPSRQAAHKVLNQVNRYYIAYRKRKRAANQEAFLAHNATRQRAYRAAHPERFRRYNQNMPRRISQMRSNANSRGISVLLTDAEITDLYTDHKCVYCGDLSTTIDRLLSKLPYQNGNVVAACVLCNAMKLCLDPLTFVKRCQNVSVAHGGPGCLHVDAYDKHQNASYKASADRLRNKNNRRMRLIAERAKSKKKYGGSPINISFQHMHLTKEQFGGIQSLPCAYCFRPGPNGVDRLNSNKGYTEANSVPACNSCNLMKKHQPAKIFISKCKQIAEFGQRWLEWAGPVQPISICGRKRTAAEASLSSSNVRSGFPPNVIS